MRLLKKIIKIILLISIILFFISLFKKNNLPDRETISNSLFQDPIQQAEINQISPVEIKKGDFQYTLTPGYHYELYGLVVSQYDSENIFDIFHKNDPLNTKDLCVVWGDNLKSDVYKKLKFTNGEFSCSWRSRSQKDYSWYQKFSLAQISNSHVLPSNNEIYKIMKSVNIGDQIHIKGYLTDYTVRSPDGSLKTRHSSTVRTDTGDGACEVIYVTDFEILKKQNTVYHIINRITKYTIPISFALLFIGLFIPEKSSPIIHNSKNYKLIYSARTRKP